MLLAETLYQCRDIGITEVTEESEPYGNCTLRPVLDRAYSRIECTKSRFGMEEEYLAVLGKHVITSPLLEELDTELLLQLGDGICKTRLSDMQMLC